MSISVLFAALASVVVFAPVESAPQAGRPSLRVCTFNIRFGTADDKDNRWELRREAAIEAILASDPHIVGLQELLAGQRDELAARLEGFHMVAAGRDDGRDAGEMTAILFRRERFDSLDSGHFWLSPSGEIGSVGWDASMTRMASWVLLRDRHAPGKPPILVIDAHLDHVGKESRLQSAKLIKDRLARYPDTAAVVIGDFNCTEDDPPYRELTGERDGRGLMDAYRIVHPQRRDDEATYQGFDAARTKGSRIDWILASADLTPMKAAIDRSLRGGRLPSDHFPVTATLEWK